MADVRSAGPDLDALIKLFTGPNSATLYERHYASLERLCSNSAGGFLLTDLPKVQKIVELTFELLRSGVDGFLGPTERLLRTLSKPFAKKLSTDELRLLGNAENLLRALGRAFEPGYPRQLQVAVTEALQAFMVSHGPRPSALQLASAGGSVDAGSSLHHYLTNARLLVESGVAGSVVRGLARAIVTQDELLMLHCSSALLSFSYLPTNCSQLVSMGVLSCMPALLGLGYKHEITAVAVELLWNVLEKAPEAKQQLGAPQPSLRNLAGAGLGAAAGGGGTPCDTEEAAAHSRDAPEQALEPAGDAEAEDQAQPAGDAPGLAIGSSGNGDADMAAVGGELCRTLTSLFRSVLANGNRDVDKELRNTVLVAIRLVLDASPQAVAECHGAGLSDAVMAVACAPEMCSGAPHVKPWALSTDEIDLELKLLCWNVIVVGAEKDPAVLEAAKAAVPLLLQYLDVAAPTPAVLRWNADRCSSLRCAALAAMHRLAPLMVEAFLSSGGVGVLLTLLATCAVPVHVEAALRHLHVLVAAAPEMAEVLGAEGGVPVLLDLIQGTTAVWPQGLRQVALQLLALMCSVNSENRRRLRKAHGLDVLLGQLSDACTRDATLPSPFVLATLDAVWSGVVPDRKNVARFLVADGMDLLLTLLEVGNRGERAALLSVLADLLDNPRSHTFFHEWRSDRDKQTAAHLLISIWKEEGALRGMTVEGVLSNTARPLRGLDKRTCWVPPESVAYGNLNLDRKAKLQAIMDSSFGDKMLAKVYTVFKLIGFANMPYVSLEDQAELCMIEKYVKFKQGEVWQQIKHEFDEQGMRPTAPDRERLASGIELSEALARAVREAQQQVLERHVGTAREREARFFENMQTQKEYEREMRFFNSNDHNQMSMAELRAAKQKKEDMLKNSLKNFHVVDSLDSTAAHTPEAVGV